MSTRSKLVRIVIVVCISTFAYWSHYHLQQRITALKQMKNSSSTGRSHWSFDAAIRSIAAAAVESQAVMMLSVVDDSYLDMAENLFETSIKKHGHVDRHVFFSIGGNRTCQALREIGANCVQEFVDAAATSASDFGTAGFRRKVIRKVDLALRVLERNISVFVVDLDIVFFRDPMPYLTNACLVLDCDIVAQLDYVNGIMNTGFYLARPTPAVISRFLIAINTTKKFRDDQDLLNRILKPALSKKKIKMVYLSAQQFPTGRTYFGDGNESRCDDCVIFHNNWIVGHAAKVYRFKEAGLWDVDGNGYYSNKIAKYLSFDNSVDFFPLGTTTDQEKNALASAFLVGFLLNRIVILPTFRGYTVLTRRRSLLDVLGRKFVSVDTNVGVAAYREHLFLDHRKVPDAVRKSKSPLIQIGSGVVDAKLKVANSSYLILSPQNVLLGPTTDEILQWFNRGSLSRYSVLRFYSLYSITVRCSTSAEEEFRKDFELAQKRIAKALTIKKAQ